MYTPANEYEPKVATEVIQAVVARANRNLIQVDQGDLSYIHPMTFPFTASSVDFENLTIPSRLGLVEIRVILSRWQVG